MEYKFKSIPLGRQGRRRDWTKVDVLILAPIRGLNIDFAETK
jgi:hypothetical protein